MWVPWPNQLSTTALVDTLQDKFSHFQEEKKKKRKKKYIYIYETINDNIFILGWSNPLKLQYAVHL